MSKGKSSTRGKVLFVNLADYSCENNKVLRSSLNCLPPINLMYLSSISKELNFESLIKDYQLDGNILNDIKEIEPHYLVAEISISNFKLQIETLKTIKYTYPNISIILFGKPFVTYNTNAIYENNEIDFVIIGEPEFVLRDILNGTPNNENLGLCYRDNFQAIKNNARPFIENLDNLCFPDRDCIDNTKYTYNKEKQTIIKISRGCYNRQFDSINNIYMGEKERFRSIKNVIDEISECVTKYDIKNYVFSTDTQIIPKNWITELCNEIIKRNLKIHWISDTYIEVDDNDFGKLLSKSGCIKINLCLKSASEEIIKKLNNKEKLNNIKKTVNILHKNNIKIYNNFYIGYPWDNERTICETINFACTLNSKEISFGFPSPIPGSAFFAFAMLNQLVENGFTLTNSYNNPIAKTLELTKEQLKILQENAYSKFSQGKIYIIKKYLKNFFHKLFR